MVNSGLSTGNYEAFGGVYVDADSIWQLRCSLSLVRPRVSFPTQGGPVPQIKREIIGGLRVLIQGSVRSS